MNVIRPKTLPCSTSVSRRAKKQAPKVMVHSDIDHCFVQFESRNKNPDTTGVEEAKRVLQSRRDTAVCGLSTARCLAETVRLAGLFAGVPLAFVATHAGQQLFLNDDNKPADEFLSTLTPEKADSVWKSESIGRFGWDLGKVNGIVFEELERAGFRQVPNPEDHESELLFRDPKRPHIFVNIPEDQPFLKMPPGEEAATVGRRLIETIAARATDSGLRGRVHHLESEADQVFTLKPQGLNKSELLKHLTRRFPQTTAVVVAGDKMGDALELSEVEDRPIYRIAAGRREAVVEHLQDQPDVQWVEHGRLGPGLEFQLNQAERGLHRNRAWKKRIAADRANRPGCPFPLGPNTH